MCIRKPRPELLSPRGIYLSCLSGKDGAERANRHASEHATFRTETGCFRSLHTVLYCCTALCRQPREPPTRSLPDCEEEEYLFPTCENRQKTANDIEWIVMSEAGAKRAQTAKSSKPSAKAHGTFFLRQDRVVLTTINPEALQGGGSTLSNAIPSPFPTRHAASVPCTIVLFSSSFCM